MSLRGILTVANHLTPPRQYLLEGTEHHLPFRSETLSHFQTLARGGLGAGWGAGACTFSCGEMKLVGIDPASMGSLYSEAAQSIGVSLDPEDDTTSRVCDVAGAQPPLQIDENAQALLAAYRRKSGSLNENGFFLGKAPLAVLTQDREQAGILRRACPYHNMDYYSDHGGAVYRPAHTLAELKREQGFEHLRGYLALEFAEKDGLVSVVCRSLTGGEGVTFEARKVVLAAGALNSARLVVASSRKFGLRLPLLSNEVRFLPSLNLSMLGRLQGSRKHSLAQLVGVTSRSNGDLLISYFFSYDSLLLFRLVRDMPLPVWLGHLLARTIVSSLTIATLHFPDRFTRLKWIRVPGPASGARLPELEAEYRYCQVESRSARIAGWHYCTRVIGSQVKSSVVPFGSTTGSRSAIEMSKICWLKGGSSSPTRPSASGVSSSDLNTPARSDASGVDWVTPGMLTNSS